jgi:hypothetical protein
MRSVLLRTALAACLCAACSEAAEDPGPRSIDGWIGQCEAQCDQQASCDPDQLLWEHGDLDNCIRDCTYFLENDQDLQFLDETPDACLEALYAQLICVYHLGCDDLAAWNDCAMDAPCSDGIDSVDEACAGIDLEDFLQDCGGWGQGCDEV